MANDLNFDFAGAEAAGISRQAILKEIEKSGKVNFDFAGARKAGISDDDIYQELSSRSQQALPELPEVIPGPPEEEGDTIAEVKVGEITAIPDTTPNGTPIMQGSLDTQTTAPSMPIIGEKGAPTTLTSTPTAIEEETARRESTPEGAKAGQVSGLQQPAEGIAYRDPVTGEVKSTATEAGAVEPAYDILFGPGGKLGTFGILTPQASVEAGKIVGKKSLEVAQAIDDLFQQHPAAGLGDALSKEAKYILNRNPNVTEEQVIEALQGVKTADQAYALSRMLGETGYIRQAVRADSDAAAGALRADLETARNKILQTVGNVDIAHAKAKYADMMATFDYDNVHNAKPILQDLDFLERFYGVTPSTGNRVVTQMKAALSDNPNISIKDALEFRGDLNYLIGKATRGREKVKLNAIKENLDGFINSVATPEQKTMIDDAISTYSRTMQNRDVLELVEKNTKDGIAVNWTKLHRDLNEANLRSPEAVDALRIAEAFSKRFGNDKKLLSIAMPQGSSPDSGGVLGAWGYIINHLKDTLAIYGNRAENLKIQKAILKSIKSGTTNLDFVNKLKANGDVPDEVSKIFEDLLQIPYKAGARQTGDVNLEPIVTPVGGRDMAVPKVTEEIPTTKPSASKNLRERYVDPQSRVSELLDKETRTFEESAELKKLQDQLIEEGTGHKDVPLEEQPTRRTGINMLNPTEEQLSARISEIANTPLESRPIALEEELQNLVRRRRELVTSGENSNAIQEPNRALIDSLRSGERVLPDLSESEVDAIIYHSFSPSDRARYIAADAALRRAMRNDLDLEPFHDKLLSTFDRGIKSLKEPSRVDVASALTGSTRRRHLDRLSEHWDDLNLHEMEGYPFKQSFDELDLSNADVYNKTEAWLNNNNTSIRELLQAQGDNIAREGSEVVNPGDIEQFRLFNDLPDRKVTDKLEEAMASLSNGNTVTINGKTFDKFHLYYNDDGEISISQPLLDAVSNRTNTVNKVEQAQQKFDTIVRDIRRLERVPAGQRTAEQSTQLAEMRRARLTARNNIERATHGGAKANTLLSSLRNSEHSVNVTDRGSGNYTIEFNGNRVSATVRSNNTVSLNTIGFREGSGEGAKFYKELYKALDAAGLKHNITSLTSINTMRLPINIYKHKLETGNLPIAGGQQKLQALMSNAIRKINMVTGRDIKHLTDGQLEELARRTGPMANIHAGINSLKLYRKAARLLSDGRALSVGALAPLINSAYSEIEEN